MFNYGWIHPVLSVDEIGKPINLSNKVGEKPRICEWGKITTKQKKENIQIKRLEYKTRWTCREHTAEYPEMWKPKFVKRIIACVSKPLIGSSDSANCWITYDIKSGVGANFVHLPSDLISQLIKSNSHSLSPFSLESEHGPKRCL